MRASFILRAPKQSQNMTTVLRVLTEAGQNRDKPRRLANFGDKRFNVVSDELCKSVFSKYRFNDYKGAQIIDMNPGVSFFSRYLNAAVQPSKHILLEPNDLYGELLNDAIADSKTNNMTHVPMDGYHWETWDTLFKDKIIDAKAVPQDEGVNKNILLTAHLPFGMIGERLLNQWLATIPERSWIMRLGRVKMLLWMPDALRKKLVPRLLTGRYKVAALAETTVDIEEMVAGSYQFASLTIMAKYNKILERLETKKAAASQPPPSSSSSPGEEQEGGEEATTPKPVVVKRGRGRKPKEQKPVNEADLPENILAYYNSTHDPVVPQPSDFFPPGEESYSLLCLTPRLIPDYMTPNEQDRDRWRVYEYTLRKLFVLKTQPLQKAIKSMGAGAEILLDTDENLKSMPYLKEKAVMHLTLDEIGAVARAYGNWDFRLRGTDMSDEWISSVDDLAAVKKQKHRGRVRGDL